MANLSVDARPGDALRTAGLLFARHRHGHITGRALNEARSARVAPPHPRHPRPRGLRARDGLQRDLGVGRARERRPDVVPEAAGHLRGARDRAPDRRLALRLPPAATPRAGADRRLARALRCRARDRPAGERRPPLDLVRPGRLPAVRARQARARGVARRVPRAPQAARDAEGAVAPDRAARRRVRRADPARARPRHRDRDRRDGRRDPARLRDAGAASSSAAPRS